MLVLTGCADNEMNVSEDVNIDGIYFKDKDVNVPWQKSLSILQNTVFDRFEFTKQGEADGEQYGSVSAVRNENEKIYRYSVFEDEILFDGGYSFLVVDKRTFIEKILWSGPEIPDSGYFSGLYECDKSREYVELTFNDDGTGSFYVVHDWEQDWYELIEFSYIREDDGFISATTQSGYTYKWFVIFISNRRCF